MSLRQLSRHSRTATRGSATKNRHRAFSAIFEPLEERQLFSLLGVTFTAPPIVAFANSNLGALNYDSGSGELTISASAQLSVPPGIITPPGAVSISINLNTAGKVNAGTPTPTDLVLTDATHPASSPLLSGEALGFGYLYQDTLDAEFDFTFQVTGGSLSSSFTGQDIGVVINADKSNFTGNFNNSFQTDVKGDLGPTAPTGGSPPSITTVPGPAVVIGSGATLNDSATLTNSSATAASTVTFYLFAPGVTPDATDNNAVYSDTVSVTTDGTYSTSIGSNPGGFSPTVTGTYQWVAVYSSTGQPATNISAVSGFGSEPETVTPTTPAINTIQQPATALVGTSVADQATVTGGFNPTGTVTFNLYNNSAGTGPALFTDTEPLSGGSATSAGYTATATGTDYWVASYNGDSNNIAVTSGTSLEPVVITPATPAINTSQQPPIAIVGSIIADQATVSGGFNPTGTVTFNLYSNATASGIPLFTDTEALVGGTANSSGYTATAAGTDYWVATYNGDSNNFTVTSGTTLEPVILTPSTPAINTTQQPATAIVGSSVADQATVTGGYSPTGTVTFNLYNNSTGTGTPLYTDANVPLSAGGVATSAGYTATAAGTDYWVATYNGDSNNNPVMSVATSEPLTITPSTPAINTTQQPATAIVGSSVADQATVTGGYSPTGTVTFNLYNNSTATGTPLFTDTESLAGGTATSAGFTATATGTDYWVASYNGDSNNKIVVSVPTAEPVTITPGTPNINTTQQPATAVVGSSVADKATVTGGFNPTGTVTFNLYNNSTATGTPLFTDTETLAGGTATSAGYTATATGTDYWVATYNGDSNNKIVVSVPTAEPVTITPGTPNINTTQQPATAVVGSSVADKATVTGGFNPTGTVTFKLYNNSTASGSPLFTDTETLAGGTATSAGFTATVTGTDYWVATYNGDSNNKTVVSVPTAEPVTITPGTPSINTSQQPATAVVGSSVADKATVTGGFNPTGTVTFKLYNNSTASGSPLFTDTETLAGGTATSAGYTATATGTDYWVATYNGDSNNKIVVSVPTAEPVTITPGTPNINTTQQPATAVVGSSVADKATVTGGFNPTGTVTFKLYNNSTASGTPLFTVTEPLSGGTATSAGYTATATGTDYWVATYSGDTNNMTVTSGASLEPVTITPAPPSLTTTPSATTPTCVCPGQCAPVSFWCTQSGQSVINCFNGGSSSTNLGNWLASTCPNLFGSNNSYCGRSLAGLNNSQICNIFQNLCPAGDINSNTCVQAFACAFSLYADTLSLGGSSLISCGLAAQCGFIVTSGGPGVCNVGNNGSCFGVANNTCLTIPQLLKCCDNNFNSSNCQFFGGDHNKTSGCNTVLDGCCTLGNIAGCGTLTTSGSKLMDSATLTGGYNPTGTITFYLFAPGVTPNATDSNNVYSDTVTVSANGTYTTSTGNNPGGYSPTATGTYQWVANYSGDANNAKITSSFGLEPWTVGSAPLTINTIAGGTVVLGAGQPLTDSADLEGGNVPTGTITFNLYAPSDTTYHSPVYSKTVTVSGDGMYGGASLVSFLPTVNGTYQWVATYGGDSNDNSISSGKGAEPETVTPPPEMITGTKFQDLTGDGFSADDSRLAGVTIDLFKESNGHSGLQTGSGGDTLAATTTTAADGTYSFSNLTAGATYYVSEVVPTGYLQTGGGPNGSAGATYYTICGSSGVTYSNNNFDDYQIGTCTPVNVCFKLAAPGCSTTTVGDLRGNTTQGETVTVTFTVTMNEQLTLVSYIAPTSSFSSSNAYEQVIFDQATGYYKPGNYSLTVQIPNSYYQIDFVCGAAVDQLGPPSPYGPDGANIFYSSENRLISADNSGSNAVSTPAVKSGDFGTIGLWSNSNGQKLIKQLNNGGTAGTSTTALGNWLASNFSHLYGAQADPSNPYEKNLTGMNNSQVASFYLTLYAATGANQTYAQIMSTALAVYATDPTLAGGTYAHTFGFNTPVNGTGLDSYNVGANGTALGFPNSKSQMVIALLEATDDLAINSATLNANLTPVKNIFSGINAGGNVTNATMSNAGLAYSPAQVRDAYGINSLTLDGAGQTIAIVDAYDDPAIFQSLDNYDAQFGIADSGPTLLSQYGAASSFLSVVNQTGQTGAPPDVDPTGGWEVEEALDVEWMHAIAPGAKIVLVEANSQSLDDLMNSVATSASLPGVSVVSMSWGLPEGLAVSAADEAYYDTFLTTPAGHQGVTFVASTGDYGSSDPEYPAFSPNVVAVGGTTLTINSDNSYNGETAWGSVSADDGSIVGSGGGTSMYEAEPAYQLGVQSTGFRSTPDVSLIADPTTGVWISDSYNLPSDQSFEVAGGTSLSAPAWAGLVALANQGRVAAGSSTLNTASPTDTQQALYSLPASDFHQVTTGTNGAYAASAGYNMVTGLGTPVASSLVADLIAYQPSDNPENLQTSTPLILSSDLGLTDASAQGFNEANVLLISQNQGYGFSLGSASVRPLGGSESVTSSTSSVAFTTSPAASVAVSSVSASFVSPHRTNMAVATANAWIVTPSATFAGLPAYSFAVIPTANTLVASVPGGFTFAASAKDEAATETSGPNQTAIDLKSMALNATFGLATGMENSTGNLFQTASGTSFGPSTESTTRSAAQSNGESLTPDDRVGQRPAAVTSSEGVSATPNQLTEPGSWIKSMLIAVPLMFGLLARPFTSKDHRRESETL